MYYSWRTSLWSRNLLPAWSGFFWKRLYVDNGDEDDQNTSSACWAIPQFGKGEAHPLYEAGSVASGLGLQCSPASFPATAGYNMREMGVSGICWSSISLTEHPIVKYIYIYIHTYAHIYIWPLFLSEYAGNCAHKEPSNKVDLDKCTASRGLTWHTEVWNPTRIQTWMLKRECFLPETDH